MKTTITGTFNDHPANITIVDGKVTEGTLDLAAVAQGTVLGQGEVSIPGVWSGVASFDNPWAIRALFSDLMDDYKITSDTPLPDIIPPGATFDAVY